MPDILPRPDARALAEMRDALAAAEIVAACRYLAVRDLDPGAPGLGHARARLRRADEQVAMLRASCRVLLAAEAD